MKKLGILLIILTLAFTACKDDSISAKDKREAEERLEENSDNFLKLTITDDSNSYWYVVAEKKNKGYKISNVMEQNHKHFSIVEAKEALGGDVFIINFIQVSKKTYEEQQ